MGKLDQVARHAPDYQTKREMIHKQKVRQSKVSHTSRRMPTAISRHRVKGDLHGETYTKRATARRHGSSQSSAAADRLQQIAEAKIQAKVNCVDGTNCGKIRFGSDRARLPVRHKIQSTLASPEERRSTYLKQVWQYRMDKRAMPQKLKELESGCNDFAACL
jgi:hypothetical protein